MKQTSLERSFATQCKWHKLPAYVPEWRFARPRLWRFDFAWPGLMIAVELEGGTWTGGRHTNGAGFRGDCEKYNEAVLLGWRVLRFTTDHVDDGSAILTTKRLIDSVAAVLA